MKTVPAKKKNLSASSTKVKKKSKEDCVQFYVSDETYAKLEKLSIAAKMSVNEYVEKVLAK